MVYLIQYRKDRRKNWKESKRYYIRKQRAKKDAKELLKDRGYYYRIVERKDAPPGYTKIYAG